MICFIKKDEFVISDATLEGKMKASQKVNEDINYEETSAVGRRM